MSRIEGVCPIIATPFSESGKVDYESLAGLVDHLIAVPCSGATLFGIAGEFYKLTESERCQMRKLVIEACRGTKTRSIVSVTAHATEVAVDEAKATEDAGADMLMLLPPFFLKPGAEWVRRHMLQVIKAVKIPIMLQYAPEQTGVTIDPAVFLQIVEEFGDRIVLKVENRPSGAYITRLVTGSRGKATILCGNAGYQMLEAFDRGAVGVMPGCSLAEIYCSIWRSYTEGRRAEAFALHTRLLALLNHIRQDVEMIIHYEKKILHRRGIIATPHCRAPGFMPDTAFDALFDELYASLAADLVPAAAPERKETVASLASHGR